MSHDSERRDAVAMESFILFGVVVVNRIETMKMSIVLSRP